MSLISYLFVSGCTQGDIQQAWDAFATARGIKHPPPLEFMTFSRLARQWHDLAWYEQPGGGWLCMHDDEAELIQTADAFFLRDDAPVDVVCRETRSGSETTIEWTLAPTGSWRGWLEGVNAV